MAKKGITRKRRATLREGEKGLSWDYIDPKGNIITDPVIIDRCNKLVIPPAWEDVWIDKSPKAKLQATGRDAKGRLQYRYHESWTKAQNSENL